MQSSDSSRCAPKRSAAACPRPSSVAHRRPSTVDRTSLPQSWLAAEVANADRPEARASALVSGAHTARQFAPHASWARRGFRAQIRTEANQAILLISTDCTLRARPMHTPHPNADTRLSSAAVAGCHSFCSSWLELARARKRVLSGEIAFGEILNSKKSQGLVSVPRCWLRADEGSPVGFAA